MKRAVCESSCLELGYFYVRETWQSWNAETVALADMKKVKRNESYMPNNHNHGIGGAKKAIEILV